MNSCPKRVLQNKKEWKLNQPHEEPCLEEVAEGKGPKDGKINQNDHEEEICEEKEDKNEVDSSPNNNWMDMGEI